MMEMYLAQVLAVIISVLENMEYKLRDIFKYVKNHKKAVECIGRTASFSSEPLQVIFEMVM